MDEDRTAAQLIEAGESLTVEFKRQLDSKRLVEAVACMANGEGGTILIGVDDDGSVVGVRDHGGGTDTVMMAAYIQNHTDPPLPVRVRTEEAMGSTLVRIDVPVGDPGPVGTSTGRFTRRTLDSRGEPGCVPMSPHEIVSAGMVMRGQDFAAARAAGATMEDLDPREFDRFRRMCRDGGDPYSELSDQDILRALGLVPGEGAVALGAILLFGRSEAIARWVPTAEVLFQDLRRGHGAHETLRVGLLQAAERLGELLELRSETVELMVGLHRIDVPTVPLGIRREAVANALVHRDYAELGPVQIQLTDDSFTVTSAGGLPRGVSLENLLETSRPRSPILAEAFRRARLVERRGKGVNEMFETQLRAGRDIPDYSRSNDAGVTVIVPVGGSDLDLIRFLVSYENSARSPLGLDELRLLHEIRSGGSATPAELSDALDLPPSRTRSTVAGLVERGVLETRGQGRSRQVHLTARFFDLAEDRSAYIRVKGADGLQQERMILDYVGAYGRITRAQAAELCQVTPSQARNLLKRLVQEGKLELVGERRGAHYVAP